MKYRIQLFNFFLILLIFLTGCSKGANDNVYEFEKYTLYCNGHNSYIVINQLPNTGSVDDSGLLGTIRFDSLDQFVDAVTEGKLTDVQLKTAYHAFPKDKDGRIATIDFKNVHLVKTPKDLVCEGIYWSGDSYGYGLSNITGTSAFIHFYNDKDYQQRFEDNYTRFFENPLIIGSIRTEISNEKNFNYFSTEQGEFKRVHYVTQNGSSKYTVAENYRLNMKDKSLKCSDTIPSDITIFCEDGDSKCIIDIFEPERTPTLDWISQFCIQTYKKAD